MWRHLSAALLSASALSMHGGFDGHSTPLSRQPAMPIVESVDLGECVAGTAALRSRSDAMCRDISAAIEALVANRDASDKSRSLAAEPLPIMPIARPAALCHIAESGMMRIERAALDRSALPGVVLFAHPDCLLRSPVRGTVVFAGPFKGYLGMVIIELEGHRHLVIAGLGSIAVKAGDDIARGDALGTSAQRPSPALAAAFNNDTAPLLYFNLRNRDGSPERISWLR
ncbi:MAG: peptidoglycan DD-metalloendopeptidase family protein [Parvibaculum sp.]|uniref:peptidoglycan DD-metalloendopeptidase family protein n=1 Tax=Parvibaculum sp. TaxID=2024848 RepID=UPI003C792A26